VHRISLTGIEGLPEITPGADLAALIVAAVGSMGLSVEAGDVLVVAQKVVSKAEGCFVELDEVTASPLARAWGQRHGKDPRIIEVILRESRRIVRMDRGLLIVETLHGFVCANAGVDSSNVPTGRVLTLPRDPDASARRLRDRLGAAFGVPVGVVISDTFGRPWREGIVNVAIGVAGLRPLADYRGERDHFGRTLHTTLVATADEIASAAELVMGKTRGIPVVAVRGVLGLAGDGSGTELLRPADLDLFR